MILGDVLLEMRLRNCLQLNLQFVVVINVADDALQAIPRKNVHCGKLAKITNM
jgi:hypothetical protein